ncbi:MAG: sucrose synthase [bacterium]
MIRDLQTFIQDRRNTVYLFFHKFMEDKRRFLLWSDLSREFDEFCATEQGKELRDEPFQSFIYHTQESMIQRPWVWFACRPRIAKWLYLRIHTESLHCDEVTVTDYLRAKELVVHPNQKENAWTLDIDLSSFNREFPRPKEPRSIGKGVEFLNRHLSSRLFSGLGDGHRSLLEFLRVHEHDGRQLMLNGQISTVDDLREGLNKGYEYLLGCEKDTQWAEIAPVMKQYGFEPGWGRTVERAQETMSILLDVLEAPDHQNLANFLGRIPMIFNVVILSPHGYFAQSDVLGLPDTGGQVIYILNQVKFLEQEMRRRLFEQGLDIETEIFVVTRLIPEAHETTCDQAIEAIDGTRYAKILRVPFRTPEGEVVPHWISRFEVWPYLERFALDAEKEILGKLGTRPDLIIGNYSDGNLVATLLADRLKVTQCNIAHALEKTKYLFSDLYWEENDDQYHFSCQFTADFIAMNSADFIITSTFQEIAGERHGIGQYESYSSFTMPGLYRVSRGIDVFDPKSNILSPGADPEVHFPHTNTERRPKHLQKEVQVILYGAASARIRGCLKKIDRPLLFSMARLDQIKNLAGLVEWYGECRTLRKEANLVVVGGHVNMSDSQDAEEQEQIQRMHDLFDRYELDSEVRWIGMQLEKNLAGELYWCVADQRGVFVQPALFEAFGLTVIEAMTSGLPTFATRYGGPLEIIEDNVSGFHIDPTCGQESAEKIAEFLKDCHANADEWDRISHAAIRRVETRYNWELYAKTLMSLARIYGFWKYVTNLEREETRRYLQMFYTLMFRPLARNLET